VFCSLEQIVCLYVPISLYIHVYMYVCVYIHVRNTGTMFSLVLVMRLPSMCWTGIVTIFHFYLSRVFVGLSRS
jgi:hypothetical protein